MQSRFMLTLAGAAIAAALSFSPASALTPGQMDGAAPTGGLVQQVHFRHRSCELGPFGWHRHTWSSYRVPCYPRARHPHRCFVDRWGYRHCAW
jgi:hypothetical protein